MSEKVGDLSARRKHPRYTLVQQLYIVDKFTAKQLGVLVNISLNGLMMASRNPLAADTIYQIIINLPEEIDGKKKIEIGIDCLWTHTNSANAGMYWSGCQIIDYSDNDITTLEKIIERLMMG